MVLFWIDCINGNKLELGIKKLLLINNNILFFVKYVLMVCLVLMLSVFL